MRAAVELTPGVRRSLEAALAAADPRPVRQFLVDVTPDAAASGAARLLRPGTAVTRVRVLRTKVKPGRRISVEADLVLGSGGTRRIWLVWSQPGAGPARPDMPTADSAALQRVLGPFERGMAATPDGAFEFLVAPFDPHFPRLARLYDPDYLIRRLPGSRTGNLTTVEPVRYRPGQRHVLRLSRPGGEDVFVKAYPDGSGERAVRLGREVADVLARTAGTRGVEPLGWLDDDHVALWPSVPGTPLSRAIEVRGMSAAGPIRVTGAALRALHDARPGAAVLERTHGLEQEVAATLRAGEVVYGLAPAAGRDLRDAVAAAAEHVATHAADDDCWTHGDFKGDNILVRGSAVYLLDFDRGALADPALDLGKMLADIWWWAGPAADGLRAALLEGYGTPARRSQQRLARAQAYESIFLLKHAARRAAVHEPGWAETVRRAVSTAAARVRAGAA